MPFNLHGIHYPISLNDIPALEEKLALAINIFSFYNDEVMPRHHLTISKKEIVEEEDEAGMKKETFSYIDLLYWDEHFACIKSFRAFLADRVSMNNWLWWRACLGHFANPRSLLTPKLYCRGIED